MRVILLVESMNNKNHRKHGTGRLFFVNESVFSGEFVDD
jgi:hypothetical protein